MKSFLINKKFINFLFLTLFLNFFILPKISFAQDFENITPNEIEKYLQLPADKVKDLIDSLISVFHSEWMNQMASAYSTPEERAVPSIMQGVARTQALNHLLIDAPLEVIFGILKNGVKIAKIFLTQDISELLEQFERESVQKAINYGMSQLLQNEIRITPGAINFQYDLKEGGKKETIIQYIMIYKPTAPNSGKLLIRFYSTEYLPPPKNKGSVALTLGYYTELTHPLPPFIVDIQGEVENYKWKGTPSMKIDFPGEVPDLGIRPLSFWEKYVLKPIETTIKEVEVIITKVTGKSPGLTDIWKGIKSFISKITAFSPAAIVETPSPKKEESLVEVGQREELVDIGYRPVEIPGVEAKPQQPRQLESKPLTLAEIQERLDDIAERIDVINQEVAKLVATFQLVSKKAEGEETKEEIKEEEEKEIKKSKENTCWVNINTASAEELQKITGIGPVLAQRIIETRPFYSLSDLIRVNGIGEATLQKIIAQGCAYVSGFNSGGGTSGGGTGGNAPSTPVSYPKILISEIQVSPTGERFIELYNPNDQNVDLTGWYIQRKTKTGTTWTSLVSSTKFEGKSVQPQSHFLIARSSTFNPEILLENLTLTENNVILIKNPNREIVDKVGWGEAQDYETAPASNPPTGQSIGRKWSGASGNYIDTDNNQNDFEIQTPTPKTKNQSPGPEPEPGEEEQNQPPIASFVFSPQNPFVGEEIIFDAASSTDDGLIVSYIWDFGDGNSTTTSQATTTYTYTSPSVDGVFSVTLQVVDNQGVKSLPKITSISVIEPTLANHIVISEIQIEGETVKDEFIELYNPTDQPIDLMGWKLTRKTSGGTENTILSNETKIKFEGIIPPKSYFLITHPDSKFKPIADVVHSGSQSLAKDNALILYDSSDNVVDKVGWGEIQDFEKAPFPQNPGKEKSLNRRKWQDFYVDNDDNSIDFEIKDPTPTNSNGETKFKSIWRGKTGEDNVNTLILANGSLFAGLNTNPGKIIKIGPETLITQTIFTTPFSSDGVHSLFFDFENNFLYTGTKSPAKILKINPETMEIIETVWEGVFPDESVNALISDGKYLYAGLTSSLATIIKLDLETKQTISWQKGPSGVVRDLIFDGQYLYAGLTGQGGLYKIEPEKMETEKYWEEAAVEALTFDGNYIYTSLGGGGIVKINPSTLTAEEERWTEGNSQYSLIKVGSHLYSCLHPSPARVAIIDSLQMTTKDIWTIQEGGNICSHLISDGNYIYIGLDTSPGKIIKRKIYE